MKNILFVNACFRDDSRTRILADKVLEKLGGDVEEVNLETEAIPYLNKQRLAERDALIEKGDYSSPIFDYAKQYRDADTIVIAAPCYDMSFPASLKAYFESIMIMGLLFDYSPEGVPTGKCKAKEIIYITTSGGPMAGNEHGFDYVKDLAKTYHGIDNARCFYAENLDVIGVDVEAELDKALDKIEKEM